MKILIVTQSVDRNDPILGFFLRWIREFSKHCERVTVIGQRTGEFDVAENTYIKTLGKERGTSIGKQILNFLIHIVHERKKYDAVFVHMTPIWVVIGAPIWLLLQKKIYLWYEVRRGGSILRLACLLCNKVFSATTDGLPFHIEKNIVMGHGIDTNIFKPGNEPREVGLCVTVGRITPVKRMPLMMEAVARQNPPMRLKIAGGALLPSDQYEVDRLKSEARKLGMEQRLAIGFQNEADVITLLQHCTVFLHACAGGLDKVLLEAMACGCLVLSCAETASHVLPPECTCTPETMGEALIRLLALGEEKKDQLKTLIRSTVEEHHALPRLIDRLVREMEKL